MTPEILLPQNLIISEEQHAYIKALRGLCSLEIIDPANLYRNIAGVVFGYETVKGISQRDAEVIGVAISTINQELNGDPRNKVFTQYLPTYLEFDYVDQLPHGQDGSHLLLGSFSTSSTMGHQVFIDRVFGSGAQTIAVDIESPRLTAIGEHSVQASSNDLPIGNETITTISTNNLFPHLGDFESIAFTIFEINRVLRSGGCYVGIEPAGILDLLRILTDRFEYQLKTCAVSRSIKSQDDIGYLTQADFAPVLVVPDEELVAFKLTKTIDKKPWLVEGI